MKMKQLLIDGDTGGQFGTLRNGFDFKAMAEAVLRDAIEAGLVGTNMGFVGESKVFIKETSHMNALDRRIAVINEPYRIRLQSFFRMVTIRCHFYEKLYTVRLAARREIAARKRALEEETEARRVAEVQQKIEHRRRKRAAMRLQTLYRGYRVRRYWNQLQLLVEMRKKRTLCDGPGMMDVIHRLRKTDLLTMWANGKTTVQRVHGLESFIMGFRDDVSCAGNIIRLLDAQEDCLRMLEVSSNTGSLGLLREGLAKAKSLKINPKHSTLQGALKVANRLRAKRNVMVEMVKYLVNETDTFCRYFGSMVAVRVPNADRPGGLHEWTEENSDDEDEGVGLADDTRSLISRRSARTVGSDGFEVVGTNLQLFIAEVAKGCLSEGTSNLIEDARRLGVEPVFILRLERHVTQQRPMVMARDLLRRGISTVNATDIHRGLRLVSRIRQQSPNYGTFAGMEVRSGLHMLRLLRLEELTHPKMATYFPYAKDQLSDPEKLQLFEAEIISAAQAQTDAPTGNAFGVPPGAGGGGSKPSWSGYKDKISRISKDRLPSELISLLDFYLHAGGEPHILHYFDIRRADREDAVRQLYAHAVGKSTSRMLRKTGSTGMDVSAGETPQLGATGAMRSGYTSGTQTPKSAGPLMPQVPLRKLAEVGSTGMTRTDLMKALAPHINRSPMLRVLFKVPEGQFFDRLDTAMYAQGADEHPSIKVI